MKLVDTIFQTRLASCGERGCTSYWVSPSSFDGDCGIDSLLLSRSTLVVIVSLVYLPWKLYESKPPPYWGRRGDACKNKATRGGTSHLVLGRYNSVIEFLCQDYLDAYTTSRDQPRAQALISSQSSDCSPMWTLPLTRVSPFTPHSTLAPLSCPQNPDWRK